MFGSLYYLYVPRESQFSYKSMNHCVVYGVGVSDSGCTIESSNEIVYYQIVTYSAGRSMTN